MKSALILSLQGVWYRCDDGVWAESLAQAALPAQSRILSDFDDSPTGVMAVDTQPDFAAAVIEKHLRSEGLIDGEAHVLAHRIIAAGGGSRVFYTAVPVATWQSTFTWLGQQPSVGLLFSVDAAMLALAQRHDAVLCRMGRQFRFLVSKPGILVYLTATAFSDDPDDIDTALLNLVDQARIQWLPRSEKMSLYWCDLLASEQDDGARFHAIVQRRLGVKVEQAPVSCFATASGEMRTAAPTMMQALSWRAATNSWIDRIAAAAERFNLPIAGVTAACGVGLMLLAGVWVMQTLQLQAQEARMREEMTAIANRNAGMDIPPATLLARHGETLGFLDALAGAAVSPDLLGFLDSVRRASDQRVRVMRVRLLTGEGVQGGFRVDGVPVGDGGSERALSGFLAALRAEGYQVKAEDPGYQTQQPGFFSYSVRRLAPVGGEKS